MRAAPGVLVLTADPVLARHLLSVSAAVGLTADVQPDTVGLSDRWRRPVAVLVGVDLASEVCDLRLPRRPEVYVVGRDADSAQTRVWSTRLRAAVATVPDGGPDLAAALDTLGAEAGSGRVVTVVGASGGVGASTLAAGLAVAGARSDLQVLLVDGDTTGGGIDIVLGAEHLAGWRWSRLEAARGHLGDLAGQLPHTDGVDVLSADRDVRAPTALGVEQMSAVLASAARSHDLTVVDLPRRAGDVGEIVLRRSDAVLVVVRSDVRGIAAAGTTTRLLVPLCRTLGVVVRSVLGPGLDPVLIAGALDLPVVGTLEDDREVVAAAGRGDPPGRSMRTPLGRLCSELLLDATEVAA